VHYNRAKRHDGNPLGGRARARGYVNPRGYVIHKVQGRKVREHRAVMSEMLGRPLAPHEKVHHLNGERHDNRPENLELWVSRAQPQGQRLTDLVAFVVEFYPDEVRRRLSERGRS
jgi:hypothetical protein